MVVGVVGEFISVGEIFDLGLGVVVVEVCIGFGVVGGDLLLFVVGEDVKWIFVFVLVVVVVLIK